MKNFPAFRTFILKVCAASLVLCGLQVSTQLSLPVAMAGDSNSELDAMLNAGSPPAKKAKPVKKSDDVPAAAASTGETKADPASSPPDTGSAPASYTPTDSASSSSAPSSYTESSSGSSPDSSSNGAALDPSSEASTATGQGFGGAYNEAPESSNLGAAELNNNGVEAILRKDYPRAVEVLEQAVKADPNYRKARENLRAATYNLGMQIYDRHEFGKALPVLQRAAALTQQLGGAPESDLTAVIQYCQKHAADH